MVLARLTVAPQKQPFANPAILNLLRGRIETGGLLEKQELERVIESMGVKENHNIRIKAASVIVRLAEKKKMIGEILQHVPRLFQFLVAREFSVRISAEALINTLASLDIRFLNEIERKAGELLPISQGIASREHLISISAACKFRFRPMVEGGAKEI